MQSFRKNYRGVSKKTRDARTYERTDGGEIIGSLGRRTSEEPKIPKKNINNIKDKNNSYRMMKNV